VENSRSDTTGNDQRWDRIRFAVVDFGRILRFSFGPVSGPGVKNLVKFGPGVTFPFRQ